MAKKRYVQVGVGSRARFFYGAIASKYKETSEILAFCDINKTRMEYANNLLVNTYGYENPVPMYTPDEFDKMIEEQKPDYVIVTSIDRTHHKYIKRAMELGCDVISEKPMTMDMEKCNEILDAIEKTGRELRVTFNYRYAPHNSKIRELIMNDTIGKVNQVHFEWCLNTSHGADYFRRWHRDKKNSGGLMVHKSTHHFDLVNFWLGTYPETVYAQGGLKFYGKENAEERGITKFYNRTHGSENAIGDPFAFTMAGNELLESMYLNAEHEDGYIRDQSVFGDNISIEDTMNVLVTYNSGAIMSYSLNAYSPIEGFDVVFTGTKGRIEMHVREKAYVNGSGAQSDEGATKSKQIVVYPMFAPAYEVEVEYAEGGHGGGDDILREDIFGNPEADPLNRAASHVDGVSSILTGICANKSMASGMPVKVEDVLGRKFKDLK
ncbi:MAG: Gfo/Idh/MocA family oxidoreductase [Clostridia bacterium]|nr:Gfo/Idh/MocA family oxidoreductase [Clostridia bacterium]